MNHAEATYLQSAIVMYRADGSSMSLETTSAIGTMEAEARFQWDGRPTKGLEDLIGELSEISRRGCASYGATAKKDEGKETNNEDITSN